MSDEDGDNVGGKALKTFIERIEFIQGEIDALNDDKKDLYAEIKGQGFSPKIIKLIVRRRKMDPEERKNEDAILELYETALGMA
jgi:uncharacterized protein (UPF0335 family)